MIVTLVLAVARNRVIGRGGGLPWRLPDDLKNFRRITMGKPVLMGRRTWESLPRKLDGRRCIVLSGRPLDGDCEVAPDPDTALALCAAAPEVMVIGGARVFEACWPRAGRLCLTAVEAEVDGDALLPDACVLPQGRPTREEFHPADGRHAYAFRYQEFELGRSRR